MSNICICPKCEGRTRFNGVPRKGQQTICPLCDTKLEVVALNPLELDVWVPPAKKEAKKNSHLRLACPECEADMNIGGRVREGQVIRCNVCKTDLEVVSDNPVELDIYVGSWRQKGSR